jgi:lanosterol synthase
MQSKTDHTRWRLKDDNGRHTWHFLQDGEAVKDWPQSIAEKHYLNLPLHLPALRKAASPLDAARNGLEFFEKLQLPSGHWGCESGGPMIFSAGIVIALFVTDTPIPAASKIELRSHIISLANKDDGGWGIHTTGHSTLCGTVINYCVLRILGLDATHPVTKKARAFIKLHGGATHSSIWGKIWLAVLGVVDWDLINPIPPEIWLLPDWLPIAPRRMYAPMRMTAQSIGYIYSRRYSYRGNNEFLEELRSEVLVGSHQDIAWARYRNTVAQIDYLEPRSWVMNFASWSYLNVYKRVFETDSLKQRAESRACSAVERVSVDVR